ncbi:hypothetical protein Q361_10812 [Flavobacterium croceum DSM 17960]|uniref:TonB dependent receptor n=1 Tax=Flavobacterium croceum DSM 17960 TaxID=1121886 RepID=A0A2S4N7L1_9FLAO|nr:TonB-dependent receptor [Flavobacterium croceum]POS01688.1 hypothetical protein Q361_10812 [Flavobacterium croceum DSM 17960]
MNFIKNIEKTTIALLIFGGVYAQKNPIGSEVVNVVKPYTPSVSDAFKVKEIPTFEDEVATEKEVINYAIFSFPVASTFTPSKGKAAAVEKSKQEKYFDNYATLAAGNYTNINAELFVTHQLENNNYVGAKLKHLSSQGGIKNVELKNSFSNSALDVTYGNRTQQLSWNIDLGYQNQMYNWYGVPHDFFTPEQLNAINPKQNFNTLSLGGKVALSESILKDVTAGFTHFSDKFSSSENRFVAKPNFEIQVLDQKIKTQFIFDYLGGSFDKSYLLSKAYNYGATNLGLVPSFQITRDDLLVNIGAKVFYSVSGSDNASSKFYVYPNITASYKLVGDLMIGYAGAEGNLQQNSYKEFVDQNNFVSPTLQINPTDQQYDVFVGLKGKLASGIGYNIKGFFTNENYKPMFVSNVYDSFQTDTTMPYVNLNSFEVLYDTVKTISFFGELKADVSKDIVFGIQGTLNSYTAKNLEEVYNLPALKLASTLDFQITPKWYAGFKIYFTGERKDRLMVRDVTAIGEPAYTNTTVKLNSFFDANAHVGFKYNDRWTFFVKSNNMANQNYQKWTNYPVQGIQVLLGANYKFDF